jgi:hypothetical protein
MHDPDLLYCHYLIRSLAHDIREHEGGSRCYAARPLDSMLKLRSERYGLARLLCETLGIILEGNSVYTRRESAQD